MRNTKNFKNIQGVPDFSVLEFMPKKNNIALVIPVINEGQRIINQLIKIQEITPNVDIVIADGGSTDESSDFFNSQKGILKGLLIKRGKGGLSAQLRMAFYYCILMGYDGVITMDGNGKDGIEGIEEIRAALAEGYDFVQGSRFIKNGKAINTPIQRYWAIKLIHAPLVSILSQHKFTDTTNGFRGHSVPMLTTIDIFRHEYSKYELIPLIPISASRGKMRVTEVPVSRSYPKGTNTPTKIRGFRANLEILIDLIHLVKVYSLKKDI